MGYAGRSEIFEGQRRYASTSTLYLDKVAIQKEIMKVQLGKEEMPKDEREGCQQELYMIRDR